MPAETHRSTGRVDRAEIVGLIGDLLAELVGTTEISADAKLSDLQVDDLTLIDLVEALEQELGERTIGLHFDDDELGELVTIADIADVVLARSDGTS